MPLINFCHPLDGAPEGVRDPGMAFPCVQQVHHTTTFLLHPGITPTKGGYATLPGSQFRTAALTLLTGVSPV